MAESKDLHSYASALIDALQSKAIESAAPAMEKYMKNQFEFDGLNATDRKLALSQFIKENGLMASADEREVIRDLWNFGPREIKYAAQELWQRRSKKRLLIEDIEIIEFLALQEPWWDTIDFIASNLAGPYFKKFPEQIPIVADQWIEHESMWLNRTAILFQLKYKEATDVDLLFKYLLRWKHSKEFFHRKAIGWALRELSKTNQEAVIEFIDANPDLSGLSQREAVKWMIAKGKI